MQPFLAMITPLTGGGLYPDNALPGSQPRPDNSLPGHQPYPDKPPGDPGYSPPWAQIPPSPPSSTPGIPLPEGQPDPDAVAWVNALVPGHGWMWLLVPAKQPPRPDNALPTPEPKKK